MVEQNYEPSSTARDNSEVSSYDAAIVDATIYVGDQIARLIDVLGRQFGAPTKWRSNEAS